MIVFEAQVHYETSWQVTCDNILAQYAITPFQVLNCYGHYFQIKNEQDLIDATNDIKTWEEMT